MKVVIADNISPQGLELLRERGWNVVAPSAAALRKELAGADGLIV